MALAGLAVLELLVGIGAVAGGASLALAPDGSILHMPLDMLNGTPFRTYLIPGLLLGLVVGGSNILAAVLTLLRKRHARPAGILAGSVLVVWILTQLALVGYQHPLQPIYLAAGVVIVASSWRGKARLQTSATELSR